MQQAQSLGYSSIAITDINNTSACLNFIRLAPKYDIKPIVGVDFRNGVKQQFVGLAQNNQGFLEINRFLSEHIHQKRPIPDWAPAFDCVFVVYPFEQIITREQIELKPNELIGVRWQELNRLRFAKLDYYKDRLVIQQPVSFRHQRDFNLHRLLRAIDKNTLLSKLSIAEQASKGEMMLPIADLFHHFRAYPFIIQNTERILEACSIQFDFSQNRKSQNKQTFSANMQRDIAKINALCQEGLTYRYNEITPEIEQRLDKELQLIQQMRYVPFFLINWDIVRYAKSKNYYHIGRGSGANSIVAYLLGITDVDPIDLDLYFERFMNLYRANPPDFDIDFSSKDREDVTHYIFDRYGQNDQVALLATYNTFRRNAAIRELGKVFGLPRHEIDVLNGGKYRVNQLDELSKLTHRYAQYMQGLPNHLSVHTGGILISEQPINYFCATDLPPKGFPTTQFDMFIAEDVGLYKYDILAQRGLGKIKDALELVKQNRPDAPCVDIHNVKSFIEDKQINAMVSRAECIGCFYVESPAMRMLLRKLEVDNYLGLVAASSIIRPGVAKSGMMREYILRHKHPERRKQAHPLLWKLMEETYGVMVYQEDVIKVAHHYGGLTLGEADVLRRGMSGKYRSREEFQKVKKKFFTNCAQKGEDSQAVQAIWKQIESFAGYAFAKGHSASYTVESYQSLYLKHYYPLEYMVATINNGGGFYRKEIYLYEARKFGAVIHLPDINQSKYETTIQGNEIYLGFHFLHSLERKVALQLVEERTKQGEYQSLTDFIQRVSIGIEQLDILIRIDAFRFTGEHKRNLLWQARIKLNYQSKVKQNLLFQSAEKRFAIPDLPVDEMEHTFDEIELLGFPLRSPFQLLEQQPKQTWQAKDMKQFVNQTITLYGYLVTIKNTKTSRGQRMNFGTFLDQTGDWIDTVHFPPIAKRYPFRGYGIYRLTGKVVEEFGFLTLEVTSMAKMNYVQDSRYLVLD